MHILLTIIAVIVITNLLLWYNLAQGVERAGEVMEELDRNVREKELSVFQ